MICGATENQVLLDPLAVRSFLMERFKVPDGTGMSECCYHYTTVNVLEEFLKDDGDILCTHCRTLNDSSEFAAGVELLASYMKVRNWNQDLATRIINQMNGFAPFDLGMPWIFSLSIYNDSLFQWINYTDRQNGGYAVGFAVDSLLQMTEKRVVKANQNLRHMVSTFFLPCLYLGIDDGFKWLDDFFKECYDSGVVYALRVEDWQVNNVFALVSVVPMFVKEKSFFFEGEWRLILEPNFDDAYKEVVSLAGRPRMKAHIKDEVGLLRDTIKSVIVSPHGNHESLCLNALNLKRRHKANFNMAFSASRYRG